MIFGLEWAHLRRPSVVRTVVIPAHTQQRGDETRESTAGTRAIESIHATQRNEESMVGVLEVVDAPAGEGLCVRVLVAQRGREALARLGARAAVLQGAGIKGAATSSGSREYGGRAVV